MSTEDDRHALRMGIGQSSMALLDAMEDDVIDALEQCAETVGRAANALANAGLDDKTAAGLLAGLALSPYLSKLEG